MTSSWAGPTASRGGVSRRGVGGGRTAALRGHLVDCPRCAAVWLIPGAREDDRHVCKDCGEGFVVRFQRETEGGSVKPDGAAFVRR